MIQPTANGVLHHDAASAPSGVALVAWSGDQPALPHCGERELSIRRIELDGSMSEVVSLGPVPILPKYETLATTLSVSSAGAGMYAWTESSFHGHGAAVPTLHVVVVD